MNDLNQAEKDNLNLNLIELSPSGIHWQHHDGWPRLGPGASLFGNSEYGLGLAGPGTVRRLTPRRRPGSTAFIVEAR